MRFRLDLKIFLFLYLFELYLKTLFVDSGLTGAINIFPVPL